MSIQSGLVRAFQDAQLRAEMAEGEREEIETLLAQWFIDSDEGARTFLREIARHQREREKASGATEETAAAPADKVQGLSRSVGAEERA